MTGFDPQMSQGMALIPMPETVNVPMHMTPEASPVGLSFSWTGYYLLLLPDAKLQTGDAKTSTTAPYESA